MLLLEASTGRILKIWYENNSVVSGAKHLITEEVELYRKNPFFYMSAQRGIR